MQEKYTCINCSTKIKALYKKYNASVLKLSTCEICGNVADKYVEFDPVIIIIDLVLLSKTAYHHVLYNTEFQIYWKLAIMFEIAEAYTEYALILPNYLKDGEHVDDLLFYKVCFRISVKMICFIFALCLLTFVYKNLVSKKEEPSLLKVCKAMALSSFGILLLLPSIIWNGSSIQEFYIAFVSLYTTLSQLLAYTVICQCPKMWSIFVIIVSYYIKVYSLDIYDTISFFTYTQLRNEMFTSEIPFVTYVFNKLL